CGQTASTGALTGIALDPFGAALPVVTIDLIREGGSEKRSVLSDENGLFAFPLLPPGKYELHASKANCRPVSLLELQISVTETLKLEILLQLAANYEQAKVSSSLQMVQTETSALGRVVDERGVLSLPLVTRNFTQISGLSPGVVAGVFNSGELGLGGTADGVWDRFREQWYRDCRWTRTSKFGSGDFESCNSELAPRGKCA
ncbi:MAG TPA: carboxypeptidase-like regulatory domain-containing protein, partial [Pyrinomonadaceae bacterium]|nr:carboxypeptidase-like regulatory domain-containing protein [Pyrinomonadaceae bacterium]